MFDWVWLLNPIECNLMDLVWFGLICSTEFDWLGNQTGTKFGVRFGSITKINRTQSTDWVRFPNVRFTMPGTCLCYFRELSVFKSKFRHSSVHWDVKVWVIRACSQGGGRPLVGEVPHLPVVKVHLTPKYFFRLNNSLHLLETHCVFLPLFSPNLDFFYRL